MVKALRDNDRWRTSGNNKTNFNEIFSAEMRAWERKG